MDEQYVAERRKLAKAIEECLVNGLGMDEIGEILRDRDIGEELGQECFLVARVGNNYKCFPVRGIQARTLAEINTNRMHSGEGTKIELEEVDLRNLCQNQKEIAGPKA